jgi:hypothetical protein
MASIELNIGGNSLSNFSFNITNPDGTGDLTEYVQINLKIKFNPASNVPYIGFELIRIDTSHAINVGNQIPHDIVCDVMTEHNASDTEQTLIGVVTEYINELNGNSGGLSNIKYAIKIKYKNNANGAVNYINDVFVLYNALLEENFNDLLWETDVTNISSATVPFVTTNDVLDAYIRNGYVQ